MVCNGKGGGGECRECGGTGVYRLTSCVRSTIPDDVWEMLDHVFRFRESKVMPLAGGTLDQTQSFLTSLDFVGAEVADMERQAMKG